MTIVWISFIVSVALIIVIAQKNLWLGLFTGALSLGLFNLSLPDIFHTFFATVTDASILLMAIAVGLIPLIGSVLDAGGLMSGMIDSLSIKKKSFFMAAPAFMGLLVMPGGALLSAPVLKKVNADVSDNDLNVLNVWFRHNLILIYPLAGLLPTTKMANMNLYYEMILLIPGALILSIVGYLFFIAPMKDNSRLTGTFNHRNFWLPIFVITSAPILHLILINLFKNWLPEVPLIFSISVSLTLGCYFAKTKPKEFFCLAIKDKPWRYFLLIIGMFLYLNIFKASGASQVIADMVFSETFLIVGVAFFLGFITARAQVAVSILLPIFYAKFGYSAMTPVVFAIVFFSVFMGYLVSPIHPCLVVSLEYFKTNLKGFYQRITIPALIAMACAIVVSLLIVGN
jgi:hypothetical protein